MSDYINKLTSSDKIVVVFSANNDYCPYMGVCIQSLTENVSKNKIYEIVILQSDISETNQKLLMSMAKNNVSVRIININDYIGSYKFYTHQYFTIETYYRLFIPSVLTEYDKVLYLDSDTIINHDIADLYETDIGNNLIGATWNISTIIQAQTNQIIKGKPWRDYLEKELKLDKPIDYFQAGVCLLNTKQMREENIVQKLLLRALSYNHPLVDQDVLNYVCQKRVYFFEQIWNLHNNFRISSKNMHLLDLVPQRQQQSYLNAKKEIPYIIHYAGFTKPWIDPSIEYAEIWWKYARNSLFYETIIYKNSSFQDNAKRKQYIESPILRNIMKLNKDKKKVKYYKILSKVTFGRLRKKYKKKHLKAKENIEFMRNMFGI